MELFGAEVRLRQMARLRNFVRKNGPRGFRAVLFRMVPKLLHSMIFQRLGFRAVLFRMVPKHRLLSLSGFSRFRAVLFRMVPKLIMFGKKKETSFRAVLFRMVPKLATKYEYTKTPPSSSLGGVIYVGHRFVMS